MQIFRISDYDWVYANNALEAATFAAEHLDYRAEEFLVADVVPLSAQEAREHEYVEEEGVRKSFADKLAENLAAGKEAPFYFAGTDW